MTVQSIDKDFEKKIKSASDIAGYLVASLYSGSAILYLLYGYHLARCVYFLATLYLVGMALMIIYRMLMISASSERVKVALYSAISTSLKLDFSFIIYHALLLVGLVAPFLIESAGPLSKSFAIIIGCLEIVMLASAKTLQGRMQKEQL